MKRVLFCLAATMALASSGCCCLDKFFCWGCNGPCGMGYDNCGGGCGGGCSSCGGGGGCGSGCCDSWAGGGYGGGGCANCGQYAGAAGLPNTSGAYGNGGAGGGMAPDGSAYGAGMAKRHPAHGHPHVQQRRNAGGEYEFATGPPSGGVTYPYYTNRGPRDFLAKNPRSIGP